MSNFGPSVKVHVGGNLVFSCSKPLPGAGSSNSACALVSPLREAQAEVNRYLTELVIQSGSQGHNQGHREDTTEEESGGDDDEEEELEDDRNNEENESKLKRKLCNNSAGGTETGNMEGKRTKS